MKNIDNATTLNQGDSNWRNVDVDHKSYENSIIIYKTFNKYQSVYVSKINYGL